MRRNPVAALVAVVGLCLIVAGTARADGTEESQTAVKLYRGSTIIAASDPRHSAYRANFTMDACRSLKAERWRAEAATKTSGAKVTYNCQLEERSIITFHPAPTCPALPAPEGRVADCPAGTTGAYTQTRAYTAAPYPTCAVLGEWSPTEPPADTCVPVPPPPTEQWTLCANEYQHCAFTGTRRVRFGLGTSWVERDLTAIGGGVTCRLATFGSDPAVGVTKRCELRNLPAATGTASLTWTPPTQNNNGSTLTNLAGYRIHYGTLPEEPVHVIQIENAGLSSYIVRDLSPGTYYFGVRAYASSGAESELSNVVPKVVQ
jgi:hypothetical protein